MDPTFITLISGDSVPFSVPLSLARSSPTLDDLLDNLVSGAAVELPLPAINSEVLEKVLDWMTYHAADPPVDETGDSEMAQDDAQGGTAPSVGGSAQGPGGYVAKHTSEEISPWDGAFIKENAGLLFDLTAAASYLSLSGLLDLTCKAVANLLRGKTPEQIRKKFGIEKDFTKEEESQIRLINEWSESEIDFPKKKKKED